jgi:hypothetical protein
MFRRSISTIPFYVKALRAPMKASGALDGLQYQEVAPLLGRDFSDLQLSSIVSDDATIRDLAITGRPYCLTTKK